VLPNLQENGVSILAQLGKVKKKDLKRWMGKDANTLWRAMKETGLKGKKKLLFGRRRLTIPKERKSKSKLAQARRERKTRHKLFWSNVGVENLSREEQFDLFSIIIQDYLQVYRSLCGGLLRGERRLLKPLFFTFFFCERIYTAQTQPHFCLCEGRLQSCKTVSGSLRKETF
jgi:hypothetical protein